MTIEEIKQKDDQFKYMLLSRLVQDCEYFLGNGNKNIKHLWAETVEEHITYMIEIWNNLEVKPERLVMGEIKEYQSRMVA